MMTAILALICGTGLVSTAQPAEKQDEGEIAAKALVDGAIKALGGAERLGKIQAVSAEVNGEFAGVRKISIHFSAVAKGAEHYRLEMDSFQKNPIGALLIRNGEKSSI